MNPFDMFPVELATAQRDAHQPPCPPDSRCTVCYSAEEISNAESFDTAYADDKREVEQPGRYWYWQDECADDYCVSREGEI
jgi:hypothetical protein